VPAKHCPDRDNQPETRAQIQKSSRSVSLKGIMVPAAIHSAAELGAALRAERKALGLSQADLALAAGVGLRFVVELEAGKPTVQLMRVLRVIAALGGTLQLVGRGA
jgi:y4mF family transcriptional regulator